MLDTDRFLNLVATSTVEAVLSTTINQETGKDFYIFYGTWEAFQAAKTQILRYLRIRPDVGSIWVAITDDFVKRQKPFVINWVGLHANGCYEIEVHGQESNRIAQKWASILAKVVGGDVTLYWA